MKDRRSEHGFDSMPDRMSEIDEVSKPGLPLVLRDDERFDRDGSDNDGEKELLTCRTSRFGTSSKISGRCLDCSKYI